MLANNIRKFRKRNKLSQEELARKADITYSTLIKIETRVNINPTISTLTKIAKALDTTIDALVGKL